VDDEFYLTDSIHYVDGQKLPDGESIRIAWNDTSPGYFKTVSTPIIMGRDFEAGDDASAPKVVIINESLARRAFKGASPIGRRLDPATVIGVIKDSHYKGVREQPRPVLYHPMFQYGSQQAYRWGFVSFELRYRARRDLIEAVRREVASVSGGLPIFRVNTLRAQTEQSLVRERLLAMLSSFFGCLALLLVCVGLYGLMAYSVARRTGEIGVRMALGARRGHITWLVFRETFCLTMAGIAAGLPLGLWAARWAKSLLFEVSETDPLTISVIVVALIAVAALAGYLPARRAFRVDPIVALRYE
jgi:predicted permease